MEKEPKFKTSEQVTDPKLAQEMAEIEAPYHEKTLGIFPPSRRKIAKGERAAEWHRLKGVEITESELPQEVLKIVKEYKQEYKAGCRGGIWRISKFWKVDPLIGENITTYRIDGIVDLHDNYGNWLEGDNGILIIKADNDKVVEVNKKHFMTRCVEKPHRDTSEDFGGGLNIKWP
jgi:hypothetical protein